MHDRHPAELLGERCTPTPILFGLHAIHEAVEELRYLPSSRSNCGEPPRYCRGLRRHRVVASPNRRLDDAGPADRLGILQMLRLPSGVELAHSAPCPGRSSAGSAVLREYLKPQSGRRGGPRWAARSRRWPRPCNRRGGGNHTTTIPCVGWFMRTPAQEAVAFHLDRDRRPRTPCE